jgi:hypothetical protein
MKVLAAPGTKCPMEHQPRKYITDTVPVEVPETAHYVRRLRDGSLIRATAPPQAAPAQTAAPSGAPSQQGGK